MLPYFFDAVLDGLTKGIQYAPGALGFFIVLRVTRTVDFSLVASVVIGTYSTVIVLGAEPQLFKVPVVIGLSGLAGAGLYLFAHRLLKLLDEDSRSNVFLAGIAIVIAAQEIVAAIRTSTPLPFYNTAKHLGALLSVAPAYQAMAGRALLGGIAAAATLYFYERTLRGKQIAALGDNAYLSEIYVPNANFLEIFSYVAGSSLAAISVILEAGQSNLKPSTPMSTLLLCVVGFLIGGQRSPRSAIGGVIAFGIISSLASRYLEMSTALSLALLCCSLLIVWRGSATGLFESDAQEPTE